MSHSSIRIIDFLTEQRVLSKLSSSVQINTLSYRGKSETFAFVNGEAYRYHHFILLLINFFSGDSETAFEDHSPPKMVSNVVKDKIDRLNVRDVDAFRDIMTTIFKSEPGERSRVVMDHIRAFEKDYASSLLDPYYAIDDLSNINNMVL